MRAGMVGFLEQIARVSETATCVIFNTVTIERTSFARYPFIYGTFVPTDVMTGLRHVFTGSGQTGYPANRFSMDFGRKSRADGRCAMRVCVVYVYHLIVKTRSPISFSLAPIQKS